MLNTFANALHEISSEEDLYELLKDIDVDNPLCTYTKDRCKRLYPLIRDIKTLKKQKNALILAHSYVHPDILYGVADHTGDSFGLSMMAREAKEDIIVFSAVRFMAETAKILNPTKTVIDPNPQGGCSLAESIHAETVRRLREKYPHHTFVCYINTTAEVKAECDVCVTSSNVYKIIEKLDTDKIYFLPDTLMGNNLKEHLKQKKIDKELLVYEEGSCYVHASFDEKQIEHLQDTHKNLKVLAHPECSPSVVAKAELIASTTGLMDYITAQATPAAQYLLLTECGIASRLKVERPDIRLLGMCMMCKYMKANHLENIKQALENPKPSQCIEIPTDIQRRALRCMEEMFRLAK